MLHCLHAYSLEDAKEEYNAMLVIQCGPIEAVQLTLIMCIQTSRIQFMSTRQTYAIGAICLIKGFIHK